jgi:predicted transcriptional regulator YdeE
MHPKIVQLDGFEVAGNATQTNNANEAGPDGVIPKLWKRVMQDHALDLLPNKMDPNLYAVYTNYASDANGEYTLLIGAKVGNASDGSVPNGMVSKKVPGGQYAIFTSERGPWQKLLSKPGSGSGLTSNRPLMASELIVLTSKCTMNAPPIRPTPRWKSTSA